MNLVLPIPDDLAERLGGVGDVTRRALEAFAIAEFQADRLTASELRRILGFGTRYELDGFLKDRGIFLAYTLEDVRRDLDDIEVFGSI